MGYRGDLVAGYWKYQRRRFESWQQYFEKDEGIDDRPPVFLKAAEWRNVLSASSTESGRVHTLIPESERHLWFRSMNSSQALAQSVLGNLAVHGHLHALADLKADEGEGLFGPARLASDAFSMEHPVKFLGEVGQRITKVDGFFSGEYRVAIECKFTESEVGSCSRPRLTEKDDNFERDHCDGKFQVQRNRRERCSLTAAKIRYWEFVPQLFKWNAEIDLDPCPLRKNYQLVRNLLAACAQPDGTAVRNGGHAVLLYDSRNPAFDIDGDGYLAYQDTREALRDPSLLRRCSWQRLVAHIRGKRVLPWLADELSLKYGL